VFTAPTSTASAEEVMAPIKSMKLDFQDSSKHFVLLV
jgi:hypothetical protein